MHLFYAPQITLPHYKLTPEESAHAVRVLRLGEGDGLHLTDGRGTMYMARVVSADSHECVVEVVLTMPRYQPNSYSLTVAIAPTKNPDRFEWFLEKATEVGIDQIIPMECERSGRRTVKHERSAKIVTEAAKQSLKAFHPGLAEMTPFAQVIAMPFEGTKLIAHCNSDTPRMWIGDSFEEGRPAMVLIGPEGDFTPDEVGQAVSSGFREISLGQQRLRTETAGLAAVMAMHYYSHAWASKKK